MRAKICKIIFIVMSFCVYAACLYADSVKYIFLFIGDGMSASSESAASRYLYGQDKKLIWNKFPVKAFVTTCSLSSGSGGGYNINLAGDKPYPYYSSDAAEKYFKDSEAADSAAAASAMASGKKFLNGQICYYDNAPVENIFDIINRNKTFNTGIITTTLFYHATPASFTSHNSSRNNYKQIAEEILSKTKPELLFGMTDYYYLNDFAEQNGYYAVDSSEINRPQMFDNVKDRRIFINLRNYSSALPERNINNPGFTYKNGTVNFKDMMLLSSKLLLEKQKPFFVVAEMSDIDTANHDNDYYKMVGAVYDFNIGVSAIFDLVSSQKTDMNWDNTLIIITADHATGFLRFNEILAKGELPRKNIILSGTILKIDRSIKYNSGGHTNELVNLYASGAGSKFFEQYKGLKYNKTQIIDNTDIFKVLRQITD